MSTRVGARTARLSAPPPSSLSGSPGSGACHASACGAGPPAGAGDGVPVRAAGEGNTTTTTDEVDEVRRRSGTSRAVGVDPRRESFVSTIKSREELEQLLADGPPQPARSARRQRSLLLCKMSVLKRTADARENIEKLAEFLDVPREDLGGPFEVDERFVCPNCNRSLSFLDIMTTAVESGAHIRHLASDPDTLPGAYAFRTTGAAGKNPRRTSSPGATTAGFTQLPQHYREVVLRLAGIEVVLAEDPAAAGQGVLVRARACA